MHGASRVQELGALPPRPLLHCTAGQRPGSHIIWVIWPCMAGLAIASSIAFILEAICGVWGIVNVTQ